MNSKSAQIHTRATNEVDIRIGKKIRARRLEFGLSQEKLADAIGVSFQQVQKYEKGANRVAASMLVRIMPVLQLTAQDLFADILAVPDPQTDDTDTISLLNAFQSIRSKQKRKAAVASGKAIAGD